MSFYTTSPVTRDPAPALRVRRGGVQQLSALGTLETVGVVAVGGAHAHLNCKNVFNNID